MQMLDAQISSASFRIDNWTTDDGLPSHTVYDIAQTRDGFLWLATTGGLARFDGQTFDIYTSGNTPGLLTRVTGLFVGHADTLWVAQSGGYVGLVNGSVSASASGHISRHLAMDNSGRMWGLSAAGLLAESNGNLVVMADPGVQSVTRAGHARTTGAAYVGAWVRPLMWTDGSGEVWVRGRGGRLLQLRGERIDSIATSRVPLLVTYPARQELLFVRHRDSLSDVVDARDNVIATYPNTASSIPRLVDRSGRLWVTTVEGLDAYTAGSVEPLVRLSLPRGLRIGVLFEDREGNLWAGTTRRGLFRIKEVPFRVFTTAHGLRVDQVRRISRGDSGSVFVNVAGGVYRIAGDSAKLVRRLGDVLSPFHVDRRGTLWGRRGRNVIGYQGEGERIYSTVEPPIDFVEDTTAPGVIWFYDRNRVYRFTPYARPDSPITNVYEFDLAISRISIDHRGALWVGTNRSRTGEWGLARIHEQEIETFPTGDVRIEEIRSIRVDEDGVAWLGTYGDGIVRFEDGHVLKITTAHGLAENVASDILEDDVGNFWMSGNGGIHRVNRHELNALANREIDRVHGIQYGTSDGLLNPETSGTGAHKADDGKMWFPTLHGAAVLDPIKAIELERDAPLVRIEGITSRGDSITLTNPVVLAAGQRRFEITYSAVSLRDPDRISLEYRLDGLESEWNDAGTNRRATYATVGPGDYTFRVRAMNAGGVWSEQDATLRLAVAPFFYETLWFYAISGLLALVLAYLVYAYRIDRLKRRQAALELVVADRTTELREALDTVAAQATKLRSLDEAKSKFFANISHEFRTPLSLILGPLNDVREERHGRLTEKARRWIGQAITSGERLTRLVEQLLDIARLEAGALHLNAESADIVAFVRRSAEGFASLAEREGIEFRIACPPGEIGVHFDPDQMEKIVGNLLGNALKFTPVGGKVELRIALDKIEPGDFVTIEVQDNGPGIPSHHVTRIFDRFHQADDSPKNVRSGAGIGLSLTKELVELHGGTIMIASAEGEGSTFTVRLPITVADSAQLEGLASTETLAASQTEATSEPQGDSSWLADTSDAQDVTTVLIVEDNEELRLYLRDHLKDHYRVLEASNGKEALDIAREHVPDLVVSDVMMPEMDGNKMCDEIKSDSELDFIPVILLTAKASIESKLTGLGQGADDYLTKPIDIRELMVRSANLIHSRKRLRERFAIDNRPLPGLPVRKTEGFRSDTKTLLDKLDSVLADRFGDEDFEIEALAAAMNMSRSTLYRRLEAVLGRSPMEILMGYRLDQAKQWLIATDATVSEIGYGVGFKSVPHFCKRFRERFGHNPSSHRSNVTKTKTPAATAATPKNRP